MGGGGGGRRQAGVAHDAGGQQRALAASQPGDPALSRVYGDGAAAARLKTGSLLAILVASAVGVCLPVALTRAFRGRDGYARGLLLVKCYAAGVILSTSLVHMLPDAHAALADCAVASRWPWRDFPFAGLFTLVGAGRLRVGEAPGQVSSFKRARGFTARGLAANRDLHLMSE